MSDSIFIEGLVVRAYHGVLPHEREVGQRFVLDLELAVDLAEASRSDRLDDTVSYEEVAEAAAAAFCSRRCKLIETAAGAVCDAILARFPKVTSVAATVRKPHAPIPAIFADVGVRLRRDRRA